MGREAVCSIGWKRQRFDGKVLLESESVLVRGEVRLELPFSAITRIEVSRGRLVLTSAEGPLSLELGDDAERWAEKIRNPPTLADKLGIKADSSVTVVGVEDPVLLDTIRARARTVTLDKVSSGAAMVVVGLKRASDLRRLATLRKAIAPDGAIWTIRPKGVADVAESAVRAAAHAAGLVDVKTARVSATHTADKFVIPKAGR